MDRRNAANKYSTESYRRVDRAATIVDYKRVSLAMESETQTRH